ncbi:YciI family protein [Sphingobacterium daejeonense]|uniref:YciI family protein n=1 Tax=Sphingobacterium daejeonense TaxID=371142 RepID=UPI0018D7330C|nr:YciI family protein [Sphingobacterium daejeonense]
MSRLNSPDKKGIEFDQELAEKLGADDYGMKSYYFVVLKTGPEKNNNKEFVNEAFSGHMANINRLVKEEKLIVAGPFGKNNDQFRGLFILNNVKTEEEAKEILETDPAIKSGLLSYTIYPWYGSAALPMYLQYSEKVTKSKF